MMHAMSAGLAGAAIAGPPVSHCHSMQLHQQRISGHTDPSPVYWSLAQVER